MTKKFYLTTTLPYVNAAPHLGFALEIVQADAVARHKKLKGYNVFFNFGTDEHGLKIYQKALEQKKDPQEYCDEYAKKFDALKKALNLSYNNFIRTTDRHHIKAAQEFWKRCNENGYIEKKNYRVKYCVGCELEKTDSELVSGKCPLHPNLEIEIYDEENYFFKFSEFQKPLLDFYEKNPNFVIPAEKFNEIKTFVKNGLRDFSISRLKSKMPWGIDVPNDPEHVMFVWFDALINYISAIGWPTDLDKFNKWWPILQFAGKDNLRQQAAIWQAMLIAAGLSNSKQIFIHGFITAGGQKMSKSLGNVINPFDLVNKYGTDAVRYYLLAKINPYEDSDFTIEKFEEAYNADLANGLGNLVARVLTLAEKNCDGKVPTDVKSPFDFPKFDLIETERAVGESYLKKLDKYNFAESLTEIWKFIEACDRYLDQEKPWELAKNKDKKLDQVIYNLLECLHQIAWMILPFLPQTGKEIAKRLGVKTLLSDNPNLKDAWKLLETGNKIETGPNLFPRI